MSALNERARELFLAALTKPHDDRDAFLLAACHGDIELLREMGSLLMFQEGGNTGGLPKRLTGSFLRPATCSPAATG